MRVNCSLNLHPHFLKTFFFLGDVQALAAYIGCREGKAISNEQTTREQ